VVQAVRCSLPRRVSEYIAYIRGAALVPLLRESPPRCSVEPGPLRSAVTLRAFGASATHPSPGNSARARRRSTMSGTILYTTDVNAPKGFRPATVEEIMTGARQALALRVRKGAQLTSPQRTRDYEGRVLFMSKLAS